MESVLKQAASDGGLNTAITPEQQWQVLESHPLFTGHCPSCGYRFPSHVPELIHFDCPECGWIDDSV